MIVAIIQARMGSTRLPGKVLMPMNGKTILDHLIDRISPAKNLDDIIIATTTDIEDDAIEVWCMNKGVGCYRGSDWDVLDRFYQAAIAQKEQPDTIVRICCDNPLHSHKVVDFVIAEYEASGMDYFSNSNEEPDYLEDGFDVEVFSFSSLEDAWNNAELLSEREHVCPYIKKNNKCAWKKAHPEYNYKLSVDNENDFRAVEGIFKALEDQPDFGINEVVNLLKKHPELLEANKESIINSGYKKSLASDRKIK